MSWQHHFIIALWLQFIKLAEKFIITAKNKSPYNFIRLFLYNSFITEYAYIILYTVISNEIFFQWLFVANWISKIVFTTLYTASSLFCSWIPITYQLFWRIPNYTIWENKILSWLMWIVILIRNLMYQSAYTLHTIHTKSSMPMIWYCIIL